MATGKALDGKPYAGNPHVRFDEGKVAPAAKPRRGSLLYRAMKMKTLALSAVIAAVPVALEAAYVRGDLVWKCDFTQTEAEAHGLAAHKLASNGTGVQYAAKDGATGDGAMRFVSRDQKGSALITLKPDVAVDGMVLVEADVKGVEVGEGFRHWNGPKVMMPYVPAGKKGKSSYPQMPSETGSFDWKTTGTVPAR